MNRIGRAVIGAIIGLLATAAVASAAPYEPNDSFGQAYGPLIGGQNYDGAIETVNDVDWYYFNTSAQRQLDIALTSTTPNCQVTMNLYYYDGVQVESGFSDVGTYSTYSGGVQQTGHLTYSAPQSQYALKVTAQQGCAYTFTPTPTDAYTATTRGLSFYFDSNDSDAIYTVNVDGRQVLNGTGDDDVVLGHLPPTSRITVDIKNTDGAYGWNAGLLDLEGRGLLTLWQEKQYNSDEPYRIGVVRHVVLSPAGNILEACGEANAAATCFAKDSDGDGINDDVDRCSDNAGVASAGGCPDRDGDGIVDSDDRCPDTAGQSSAGGCPDRDGDGIADSDDGCKTIKGVAPTGCPVKARYASLVSVSRHGRRISGRVSSNGPGCAGGRRVVLRRVGAAKRSYGSTLSRSNGTFTLIIPRHAHGRFYVVIAERSVKTKLCRSIASRSR